MAENIKLAEFNIDVDAVVANLKQLKERIDALKESQRQATKIGDTSSETFIRQETVLKSLTKEYNGNRDALTSLITSKALNAKATGEQLDRQQLLAAAFQIEVKTIAQAREQNKLLNKLRNEANATTAEGQAEISRLNKALDANNDFIKENVDALSQQKMNVGNYTESIKGALSEMNPFNQSIFVFIENAEKSGGILAMMQNGLKGVTSGIVGMTRAALAFIATPIGAIIGAIGLALGLVVNALTSTQEGMDKVTAVTRPLTAIFEVLLGVVQDVGLMLIDAFSNPLETLEKIYNYVKDRVISQFEALTDVVVGLFTFDFDRIKKGFDQFAQNAKESWEAVAGAAGEFTDKIAEGVRLGRELDRLTKEYENTQIRNAELLPQINAQLREQNKIAEDQTKTQAEREASAIKTIELSQQINNLKKEELELELAIKENEAARNDTTREELLEIAEIKGKIADADAQAAELQTTQQNKLNTIRKEAESQRQKFLDEQINKQKELLDLFIAEQGERARTLQEELSLEESISAKRRQILDEELRAKKISQEAYQAEILRLEEDMALKRAELAVDNAMREIEANRMSLERQREAAQFLSAELAEQRKAENQTILLQEQELAKLRLEQGLINQQEFDDAIRELSEANRIANKEIDDERRAIEKQEAAELRAIEFEQELERLLEEGATRFEIQQAQSEEQRQLELQRLAEERERGAISEELYNARLNAITDRYDKIRQEQALANERALAQQRIDIAQNLFSALAQVVDKNSGFGKALAVSQALINTYQGITSALTAPTLAGKIAGVAMATTTGFAAVKNIVSTKVPKAEGGNVSASGSANVSRASTDLRSLAANESNLTRVSASGNATVQQQIETNANQTGLSETVANAVAEGAERGTSRGSEQGLTNLSDNKNIRALSTT